MTIADEDAIMYVVVWKWSYFQQQQQRSIFHFYFCSNACSARLYVKLDISAPTGNGETGVVHVIYLLELRTRYFGSNVWKLFRFQNWPAG